MPIRGAARRATRLVGCRGFGNGRAASSTTATSSCTATAACTSPQGPRARDHDRAPAPAGRAAAHRRDRARVGEGPPAKPTAGSTRSRPTSRRSSSCCSATPRRARTATRSPARSTGRGPGVDAAHRGSATRAGDRRAHQREARARRRGLELVADAGSCPGATRWSSSSGDDGVQVRATASRRTRLPTRSPQLITRPGLSTLARCERVAAVVAPADAARTARQRGLTRSQPPATAGTMLTMVAVVDGGVEAVEEADVLVGDEHVDEAAQLALLVEEPLAEPGVLRRRGPSARRRRSPPSALHLGRAAGRARAAAWGCGR